METIGVKKNPIKRHVVFEPKENTVHAVLRTNSRSPLIMVVYDTEQKTATATGFFTVPKYILERSSATPKSIITKDIPYETGTDMRSLLNARKELYKAWRLVFYKEIYDYHSAKYQKILENAGIKPEDIEMLEARKEDLVSKAEQLPF